LRRSVGREHQAKHKVILDLLSSKFRTLYWFSAIHLGYSRPTSKFTPWCYRRVSPTNDFLFSGKRRARRVQLASSLHPKLLLVSKSWKLAWP